MLREIAEGNATRPIRDRSTAAPALALPSRTGGGGVLASASARGGAVGGAPPRPEIAVGVTVRQYRGKALFQNAKQAHI
jgi:hypothetical protein